MLQNSKQKSSLRLSEGKRREISMATDLEKRYFDFPIFLADSSCLFGAKLISRRDKTCRNAYRQQSNFHSLGISAKRISYQTWCGCFCSSSHGRLFMNLFNLLFLCTVIVPAPCFDVMLRFRCWHDESDASSDPAGRVVNGNHREAPPLDHRKHGEYICN